MGKSGEFMPVWVRATSKIILMLHDNFDDPPPMTLLDYREGHQALLHNASLVKHGYIGWLTGESYVEKLPQGLKLCHGPIYYDRLKEQFVDASTSKVMLYDVKFDYAQAIVEVRGPVVYLYEV